MKSIALGLAAVCAAVGLAACAPRAKQSHFERWSAQEKAAKEAAAKEEAEAAAAEKSADKSKPAAGKAQKPATAAPAPAPASSGGYNSLGGPTKTSTPTRAIKPAELPKKEDEDVVY